MADDAKIESESRKRAPRAPQPTAEEKVARLKAQAEGRDPLSGKFAPGNKVSRAGSRNRLQGDFIHALAQDFAENGPGIIRIVRIEEPATYLKLIASVLPKEFVVSENILSDMPDDELAEALAAIRRLKAANADRSDTIN